MAIPETMMERLRRGLADDQIAPRGPMHTDDRLRAALVRIAADHEVTAGGHRKKLSRAEMLLIARQVCLEMGWEWGRRG